MINTERLSRRFIELAEIDSESRHEAKVAAAIEKSLTDMGAAVSYDRAKEKPAATAPTWWPNFPATARCRPYFCPDTWTRWCRAKV